MSDDIHPKGSAAEVFWVFLLLGLTSFGGPVAHLGYFREAFVARRGWLTEADYADLVALCQFLPGPASSQVGIAIGLKRAGYLGAFAAWVAFTLPSVLLLVVFAQGLSLVAPDLLGGALAGLKLAALAVVAQAVWSMGKALTPDRTRLSLAVVVAAAMLLAPWGPLQMLLIAAAGVLGYLSKRPAPNAVPIAPASDRRRGWPWLVAFVILLAGLPLMVLVTGDPVLTIIEKFYRSGALVFGGGHVVLPLLQTEFVNPGLVTPDGFLAGYGAAQAVPGPLFAFAGYLGWVLAGLLSGPLGALVGIVSIYVPAALLVFGALPYWTRLSSNQRMRGALDMANAAVVGLLLAALYDPVFTSAVHRPLDAAIALLAYLGLTAWRLPPWLVVLACAGLGIGVATL